jgi:methyltransferase (TIGR00027 family)
MSKPAIGNVSDTAFWVAVYREQETQRPDALFHDPLAARLTGARGKAIASKVMGSKVFSWTLVMRTCVIDSFIQTTVTEGVDTVLNLGAGLDTRPYRLNLPSSLRWIEVDYPHMIEFKEQQLADEKPVCNLERLGLDLGNWDERKNFFTKINDQSKRVLVLTEGVVLYLTPESVVSLADDLRQQPHFRFWVVDYFSPESIRHMKGPRWKKQMRNAPFHFLPEDWLGFFNKRGWKARETRFLDDESEKRGRAVPTVWWVKFVRLIPGISDRLYRNFSGYILLEPK